MKQTDAQKEALALVEKLIALCKAHGIPCMVAIGIGDRHFTSRGVITSGHDLIDLMITMTCDARDLAKRNQRLGLSDLMGSLADAIKVATETESVTTRDH